MKLIEDWKAKWHKLWSIRLALLSALLGIAEAVVPTLSGAVPPGVFAGLSAAVAIGGAISRLVAQPKLAADPEATKPG